MGANTDTEVSALVVHGVLGEDTHQSTLAIDAVERSLRSTKHVDTVQSVEMRVECRLAHQRHVIHINTHRGTVDARANTSDIHRRRIARPIGGITTTEI